MATQPATARTPGQSLFLHDGKVLMCLEGAVTVPLLSRIWVEPPIGFDGVDYIVDTCRVCPSTDAMTNAGTFDLHYQCHEAEEPGTRTDPRDIGA